MNLLAVDCSEFSASIAIRQNSVSTGLELEKNEKTAQYLVPRICSLLKGEDLDIENWEQSSSDDADICDLILNTPGGELQAVKALKRK